MWPDGRADCHFVKEIRQGSTDDGSFLLSFMNDKLWWKDAMKLADQGDVIGLQEWLEASPKNGAAINYGHPRVWESYCTPDADGYDGPVLMITAIAKKSYSMVRMLLNKGCNIKYRRRCGDSAFIDALWEGIFSFHIRELMLPFHYKI